MTTIIHVLPEIDAAIWKALDGNAAPKKKGEGRGKKRGPQPGNNIVPDETILAMRRMHEIERKPIADVMRAYPQFSINYVRNVLGYIIRRTLNVK